MQPRWLLLLLATGCNMLLDNKPFSGPGGDSAPDALAPDAPSKYCDQIDLVFVIDDSGSMGEEQTNLAANLPSFASLLAAYHTPDGRAIDYRAAVTTTGRDLMYTISVPNFPPLAQTELGDDGAFRGACGEAKPWIERTDPDPGATLACRSRVGVAGPSFEMPLLMTKWALSERLADATNAGFVRPDALLAVVILTDEDDTSTTQNNFTTDGSTIPIDYGPSDLIAFLDQLKGNRSRWAATVIAGDGACHSPFGDAVDAARLKDLVVRASPQAAFSSICDGDLTIGLSRALTLFQTACVGAPGQ
jgi:hypothetical protein